MNNKLSLSIAVALGVALAPAFFLPGQAFSESSFFAGKTIKIIQGRRPGGLGDMRTRAVISVLPKFIPGNPNIVAQYMPGAGGRKAANHLSKAARPDGLTLGNIGGGFVANAILGQPGVNYNLTEFTYLGSGNSKADYVLMSKKELGLNSLKKLQAASGLRIATQSVGHAVYIYNRLFAWLLDFKNVKFVTGYSGPEMDLALMRGEVDIRATSIITVFQRTPEWIEEGRVDFHAALEIPIGFRGGFQGDRRFNHLPALEKFARTELEKNVLQTFRNLRLVGSPYLAPPGIPKGRVRILREAFTKLFKAPESLKAWKKIVGEDPHPLLPDQQARAVAELQGDPEAIKVFKQIAGPGPLPGR